MRTFLAGVILALGACDAVAARALEVIVFPGGFNWPLWVGAQKGFFAENGVEVKLSPTPGSVFQMQNLAKGRFDIAMSTLDNVVAYDEGQGEAPLEAPPDFFAFMGAQYGAVRLFAKPEIASVEQLRGRSLAVDAATTGYAFVLRKILQEAGLGEGDYRLEPLGGTAQRAQALMEGRTDATILTSPLEIAPEARGFRRLANAHDAIGPYQAIVGVARRAWARENEAALVGFIRGYVRALRWLRDPGHRDEAVAIYRRNIPQASTESAEKAWQILLAGEEGFQRDARLDAQGIATVLKLRSEFARPAKALTDATRYIDESYYQKAMK